MKKGQSVCPTCATQLPEERGPAFPFCSPKCKLVDLGRWLDGSYRLAGAPVEPAEDGEPSDPRERG